MPPGGLSPLIVAKEDDLMTERQKEMWAGVRLTALVVGMILGAWFVLRLTTTYSAPSW